MKKYHPLHCFFSIIVFFLLLNPVFGFTQSADTISIQSAIDSCKGLDEHEEKIKCSEALLQIIHQSQVSAKNEEKIFLDRAEVKVLRNTGRAYRSLSDLPNALKYYQKSLSKAEAINDKQGIAAALFNTGNIYFQIAQNTAHDTSGQLRNTTNYFKALDFQQRSLKLFEETGDTKGIALSNNGIGAIQKNLFHHTEAIESFQKSIQAFTEIEDSSEISNSLRNLASVYEAAKNYPAALENNKKSLAIAEATGDSMGIALSLGGIGNIYRITGEDKKAEECYTRALLISNRLGDLESGREALNILRTVYQKQGRFKEALETYDKYVAVRDSIIKRQNNEQVVRTEMQYDFDKKEAVAVEEKKQQRLILYSVVAGLALVMIFSFFIYNRFRLTQKQKKIIEQQKTEVEKQRELADSRRIIAEELKEVSEKQKHLVEEKQKEILDSINYAKRIQQALLKEEEHVSMHLPAHFILYKPKDIVAGDFYWSHEKVLTSPVGEGKPVLSGVEEEIRYWYIAATDCTGHGVPGAMMSMLGMSFLNEIISSEKLLSPAQILDELRARIIKELGQTGKSGENKDGMDISLLRVVLPSPAGEGKPVLSGVEGGMRAEWSGANNSMYHVSNGILNEIKADKQPIGFHPAMKKFTDHKIDLQKGDSIFLFTDGYADQFGGPKRKKFMYKRFEGLLLENISRPMEEQKSVLNRSFEEWKGDSEQIDDVCVIGIRL